MLSQLAATARGASKRRSNEIMTIHIAAAFPIDQVVAAIEETRQKYLPQILAARQKS